jgi:hypothetical protein
MEFRQVAATPSASTEACAPPRVSSAIAAGGSVACAFTVAAEPPDGRP